MIALAVLATLVVATAQGGLPELERRLHDAEERERREAVQGLAELATPEAWELVLEALRDPEPMVADEAQLALGRAKEGAVQEALLGKAGLGARDGLVRLRAAEALGRCSGPLPEDALGSLGQALKDKDPEVRRTVLWTIERRARSFGLEGLDEKERERLVQAMSKTRKKDKDAGVCVAAWMAEAALAGRGGPEGAARSAEDRALDERSHPTLWVAAALEAARGGASGGRLDRLVASPHRAVRDVAVHAFADARSAEGCRALAGMLADEPNRRLAWTIVGELQELSGRKHGLDPRPWTEWAASLEPGWSPARRERDGGDTREVGDRSVAFVGLPVLSERLVILVDFSGSLWMERDGTTRKAAVDRELRRTLEALPETTLFNVVPYTEDPIPWEDGLVPATKKNVARALDFFEGCKAQGKGDVWDALALAFEHEDVDTILVLTDGAPSGGVRWNLELMGELFAEKNRFRRLALDALLIDAGGLERYWRKTCEASGGRALAVDL